MGKRKAGDKPTPPMGRVLKDHELPEPPKGRRWAGRVAERLFQTVTGQVVLGITALSVIIGGWIAFDGYVAKAGDLRLVETRLEKKILKDDRTRTQERIWQLEDRNRIDCLNAERDARSPFRDQCRTLLEQLRQYDEQLGVPKKQ
jgi:hypothetical protein